jgi:hypothetical protein
VIVTLCVNFFFCVCHSMAVYIFGNRTILQYMRRIEDFRIYYNHTIHPELMRLERQRKRLLLLLVVSILLLTAVIIFELYIGILLVTLVLSIPIALYITFLGYQIRKFILTFKPKIVNLILDFIDDGVNYGQLTYEPAKFLPKKVFQQSKIFGSSADSYLGEDYIQGKIGELDFEMCELNVREYSKVRSRLNYVFRGIFLKATFQDSINGRVTILPMAFRQYLTRSIREKVGSGGRSMELMIRNPEFRKQFLAYATRNAQVRELLSEAMQESILNYRNETGKEIYLSFINKDIFVAITEPKNILEPRLFQSNVSFELVREFFEDLQLSFQIVEDFDKNH